MNEISNQALDRVLTMQQIVGDPCEAAKQRLSEISQHKDKIQITDWQILEALGKPYDTLSAAGAYYRLQAFLVHYTTLIGATVFSIFGVAATIWALKKAEEKIVNLIANGIDTLEKIFSATTGVAGGLLGLLGLRKGAKQDGELSPESLMMAVTAIVPIPIAALTSNFVSALESAGSEIGGAISRAPTVTAPAAETTATHSSSLIGPALTVASPVAAAASPTGYVGAASSLISSLGSIIGSLDADSAVTRDGAVVRDELSAARALVAAALASGVPAETLVARARQMKKRDDNGEGEDTDNQDFEDYQTLASSNF